jgi:succinyl-diaminopimelate desuccinylase
VGSGLEEVSAACPQLAEIGLAIILEPTDNELQVGCLGVLNAEVAFAGRAAHSARPWLGENAIHKAAPLLARLSSAQPTELRCGELVFREVISATTAQGGSARNVIPERFAVNLNYRFSPGRTLDEARQAVIDLVAGAAAVRFVDQAPAGRVPENNAILDQLVARCHPTVSAKQAWTDVARFAAAGIDAVNFGPGIVAQAHQPDEHASVAQLVAAARLLRAFLAR